MLLAIGVAIVQFFGVTQVFGGRGHSFRLSPSPRGAEWGLGALSPPSNPPTPPSPPPAPAAKNHSLGGVSGAPSALWGASIPPCANWPLAGRRFEGIHREVSGRADGGACDHTDCCTLLVPGWSVPPIRVSFLQCAVSQVWYTCVLVDALVKASCLFLCGAGSVDV